MCSRSIPRQRWLARRLGLAVAVGLFLALTPLAGAATSVEERVAAVVGPDAEHRIAAAAEAGDLGAEAVSYLVEGLDHEDPFIRRAAHEALERIVMRAGRPGADEERQAVAQALAEALEDAPSTQRQREILHFLSLCGGQREAAAIAPLLLDPALVDAACYALIRNPSRAAARALASAAEEADEPRIRRVIVHALAQIAADHTEETLRGLAADNDPATAMAAIGALARLGAPPPRERTQASGSRREVINAVLRVAAVEAERGNVERAQYFYTMVHHMAPAPHQLAASLVGLGQIASEQVLSLGLAHLITPGVSAIVIQALSETGFEETDERLASAYEVVTPASQGAILRILAARDASELEELLARARDSESAEVRLTAAQLLGEPPSVETALEALREGSSFARASAMDACLALAVEADAEEARSLYEAVAAAPGPVSRRLEALEALAELGDPASLEAVEALLEAEGVAEAAAKALATLWLQHPDAEQARQALEALAAEPPSGDAGAAAEEALESL